MGTRCQYASNVLQVSVYQINVACVSTSEQCVPAARQFTRAVAYIADVSMPEQCKPGDRQYTNATCRRY